jgi:CRP-like cAMP-binding protein
VIAEDRRDSTNGETNRLLRSLPSSSYERIAPDLERVELASRQKLWEPNEPIRSVYFPRTCVLSLLIQFEDESPVESATVGREGIGGVAVALGAESTRASAIAQIPGEAVRLPTAMFRTALAEDPALLRIVLRSAHAQHEQTSQSVGCNRRHSMEQRCARWLLMTHDRVGTDHFPLTQEFMAFMLGVRRATVTVAAGMLHQAGLIHYRRGSIRIVDRERLEAAACECYRAIREVSEKLIG